MCSLNAVRDINTDHSSTVDAEISLVNRLHTKLLRRLSANRNVTGILLICPSSDRVLHGDPFPKCSKLGNVTEHKLQKRTVKNLEHKHYSASIFITAKSDGRNAQ
jgi:hypothetical protein